MRVYLVVGGVGFDFTYYSEDVAKDPKVPEFRHVIHSWYRYSLLDSRGRSRTYSLLLLGQSGTTGQKHSVIYDWIFITFGDC